MRTFEVTHETKNTGSRTYKVTLPLHPNCNKMVIEDHLDAFIKGNTYSQLKAKSQELVVTYKALDTNVEGKFKLDNRAETKRAEAKYQTINKQAPAAAITGGESVDN